MNRRLPVLALAAALCAGAAAAEPVRASAGLNCRDTPSAFGTVVSSITRGAVVEGVATAHDWTKVDGDPDCWAASRYLAPVRKRGAALRISKPHRLSDDASERASRRSTPNEPIFSPRVFHR